MSDETATEASASRRRARLRTAGVIVLLLGLAGAGALYGIRTHAAGAADDSMLEGYSKPELRQMGMLYGKMGIMITDLTDDLKSPGVQASIIAGISVVVALGCFYLANHPEEIPPEER
jgi:hypothetical protein